MMKKWPGHWKRISSEGASASTRLDTSLNDVQHSAPLDDRFVRSATSLINEPYK